MRVPPSRSSRPTARLSVALVAAVSCLAAVLPASPAAAADPEYFELPAGIGAGSGITVAPEGTVYFATGDFTQTSRFGSLVPSQASPGTANGISLFPTPTFANAPNGAFIRALAYDNTQNRLWFSRSDGLIGKAETAQLVPNDLAGIAGQRASTAGLWGLDVDQTTHEAWFTEYGASNAAGHPGNRIAHATPQLGVTELPNLAIQPPRTTVDDLRYDAKPKGLVSDGAGGAWFAESDPGNPGWRIGHALAGGTYLEYQVTPCKTFNGWCSGSGTGVGITDVALAKDGSVWFTNELDNTVGRLDPGASTFTQYAMSAIDPTLGGGRPRAIRVAPDGALWVAQANSPYSNTTANALVRIQPTQPNISATVYKTGTNASIGLAAAPNGDIWFAASTTTNTGRLGRIAAGGGGAAPTPTPTPNPFDPSGPLISPTPVPAQTAAPAPTPTPVVVAPSTVGTAEVGKVSLAGDTLSSNQICVGPPQDKCALIYLVQTREYVVGFPGTGRGARLSAPKKTTKKPKTVELGKLAFTMNGGETRKVKLRLNAKARKALAKQKKIKATLVVQQQNDKGVFVEVKRKPVTFTFKK